MFSDESLQEEEDYLLESSTSTLKRALFLSMTPLISEEYFNFIFKLIFLFIGTLQLISFGFKDPLIAEWKSGSSIDIIASFFKYFMVMPYLENSGFFAYLVIFYIISGFNFVLFAVLIYLNHKSESGTHNSRIYNQNAAIFQFARILCESLSEILYLPMLEVLIVIFNCSFDEKKAQWLHNNFSAVVCYENLYFLHVFLGGLATLFLVCITGAINLLFFEPRLKSNHFLAKNNGKIDFYTYVYKTLLVIIFTTLNGYSDYVILAYLTIPPFFIFLKFREEFPFFNFLASKAHLLHYSVVTWTGFMLIFNKIVKDVEFDANLFIFFFGIALLVAIIALRREFRYDLLLINVNKTDSLETFTKHIHYLFLLCEHYKNDQALNVLLEGFVQFHKTICSNADCPCKKEQTLLRKTRKHYEMSTQDAQIVRVFSLINVFFVNMLQKKPFQSTLRIYYSLFLLDKMDQKQLALQEILTAAKFKPSFEEEFLIFRFKRIIEAELLEKKKEDGQSLQGLATDSVNELALNSIVKQIKSSIEKSASNHLEFWSQLSEDVPDLSKLHEIGNRINYLDSVLEEDWERFLRMNVCLPSLLRLYAGFLFTILCDKQGSTKVYIKLEGEIGKNGFHSARNTLAAELVNNSTPVLFISGEEATLGMITNLNQALAALLGYNKSELLNKKLAIIQPTSIAEKHDLFIEDYLMKNESRMLNKEILLPTKDKNGYLRPVFITAKSVPFAMQGVQFFALFRVEKTFKTNMYLYCNADGLIEIFSPTCLHFLNIDKKKMAKHKNTILEFIPSFFDKISSFTSKTGCLADVHIQAKAAMNLVNCALTMPPNLNVSSSNMGESQQNLSSNQEVSASNIGQLPNEDAIKCNFETSEGILPVKMPVTVQIYDNRHFGMKNYLIRIDYIEKTQPRAYAPQKLKIPNTEPVKMPFFSFQFDLIAGGYKGEILEGEKKEIDQYLNMQVSSLSGRTMIENTDVSRIESVRDASRIYKKLEENILLKNKEMMDTARYEWKDWGKGIRAYRLVGDRIYDLEELKREEESEVSEENISEKNIENERKIEDRKDVLGDKDDSMVNLKNSRNIFKSRGNFVNFLKKLKGEKSTFARNLHFFAVVCLVCVAIVSSVNHFIMANQFSQNQNSYALMDWANQRISESQLILFNVIELHLLSQGVYNNSAFLIGYEDSLRKNLKSAILTLESIQNNLMLNSFGMSQAHIDLTRKNTVKAVYKDSGNGQYYEQNFDLNQITSQIISKSYALSSKPLTSFLNDDADSDFFFVRFNILNDYYLSLAKESSLFLQELRDRILQNSAILLAILLISAFTLLFTLIILVPLFSSSVNSHQELLCIFLDISISQVKKNFAKCEAFLNHLQVGEEEDDEMNANAGESEDGSIRSEEKEAREGFLGLSGSKKRKKFKLNNRNKMMFCLKVFLLVCVIESFFLSNYFITTIFSSDIDSIVNELNVTSLAEPHFSFANNLLRQNIMDPMFNVTDQANSSNTLLNSYTDLLISLVSEIEKLHSVNLGTQASGYNDMFNRVFFMNVCEFLFQSMGVSCTGFADGSLTQGISLSFYRFIDNFREIIGFIQMIRSGSLTNLSLTQNNSNAFVDGVGIELNLLNLDIQAENNQMQNQFLRQTLRTLMAKQLETVKAAYSSTMNNRLILYVCFIILLFLVYVFFWLPLINQLNMNWYKVKRMLAIIPLEVIQGNRTIRENIQASLNIHD